MYIVTVEFVIWPEHVEAFHQAVQKQARHSLTREPDCLQFDVCVDPQARERVLLYEVYTDAAAFKVHMDSAHFTAFDAAVRDWVKGKAIQFWIRSND
ncbi:MAG: putative quinol monooxygenase [Desulfobacterales bacterium]|nr:putative quinol monooxygenase [Desulfobacterales bacterium]